jgi:hypothetical protein
MKKRNEQPNYAQFTNKKEARADMRFEMKDTRNDALTLN